MIKRSYEFLDGDSLKRLFIALVCPHLEYSNAVWSPRYIKDKKLMERVQRRATKLIPDLKELPYETRLKKLQLPSLYYRRARGDMIEVYKYMYNIYDVDTSSLLDRDQDSHNNNNICLKSNIQTSSVDYAPRELTHACSRSETCSRSDTEACDMCYVF